MLLGGGVYTWYTGGLPNPPTRETIQESKPSSSDLESVFEDSESLVESANVGSNDTNNNSSSSEKEPESVSENEDNTTPSLEQKELTVPSNVRTLIEPGLVMQKGATLYVEEDANRPDMKYTCEVSQSLYEQLSSNFQIGVILAPQEFFDEVNTNSHTVIDWITAFNNSGKEYLTENEVVPSSESSTGYMVQLVMTDIEYVNINRKFTAIGYVKITNGSTVTYKYSAYEPGLNYRSNARSVAYLVSSALNAYDREEVDFSEEQVTKLKKYVMESRDYAHGLTTPTYDDTFYSVKLVWFGIYGLKVGESTQITCRVEEDVEVEILFESTDENVFTIDTTGKLTAIGEGTATLKVYVAGLYAELDVEIT